jgi:hypothetical protein
MNSERFLRRREAAHYLQERGIRGTAANLAKIASIGGGPAFRHVGAPPAARVFIRAELTACNTCTALGISVRAAAPVLAICRSLVAAGHDPHKQLRAYRGDVLCLTVRSIGEGAGLTVADDRLGRPKFRRHTVPQSDVTGPYDAKIGEARR